ncbi:MAG TPA: hypothetical protein VG838_01735 [Opitutaceae bacterium]|nr:hypothetical protein [Opitutaceae bacterium]
MLDAFLQEWTAAREKGVVGAAIYVAHVGWDVVRTVPSEWLAAFSRTAVLAILAVGLGLTYCSIGSTPLVFKVLGCAALSGAIGLRAVGFDDRRWRTHLRMLGFGLVAGFLLATAVDLKPRLASPPTGPLVPATDPALTGPEIHRRMAAVYREANSYADTGEIQTTFRLPFRRTSIKTFSTAFVRGRGFRFEFKDQFQRLDPWNEYAVWLDGAAARSWWTIEPQVVTRKDLAYALAGPAGISSNASTNVPGLLFPGSRIGLFDGDARYFELLGMERVDGSETYKLRYDRKLGWSYDLWVDAHTYLIARVATRHVLSWAPGASTDELLIYHPRLNGPVDPAALMFQPGPARPILWRTLESGQMYVLLFGIGVSLVVTLLNFAHRRALRGTLRRKKEVWLGPLTRRFAAGHLGAFGASVGLWLGGVELDLAMTNWLLALFMMQGGFGLYVMHRRTRGHARFAAVA